VTRDMDRDLEAFARGEVSRHELVDAYGPEAGALADLHERVQATLAADFDEDAGWRRVVEGMDTPATVTTIRRSRRPRSVVALAVAAALTIGGSALAAVEVQVRKHAGSEGSSVPLHTEGAGVTPEPIAAPALDADQPGTATGTPSTDGSAVGTSIDNGGSGRGANPGSAFAVPGENGTSGEGSDHATSGGGSGSEHGSSGDGNDEGSSSGDGDDQGSGDGSGGNDQGDDDDQGGSGSSGGSGSGGGNDNDQGSGNDNDQGTSQGDSQN
jgi:hypothetical protein